MSCDYAHVTNPQLPNLRLTVLSTKKTFSQCMWHALVLDKRQSNLIRSRPWSTFPFLSFVSGCTLAREFQPAFDAARILLLQRLSLPISFHFEPPCPTNVPLTCVLPISTAYVLLVVWCILARATQYFCGLLMLPFARYNHSSTFQVCFNP